MPSRYYSPQPGFPDQNAPPVDDAPPTPPASRFFAPSPGFPNPGAPPPMGAPMGPPAPPPDAPPMSVDPQRALAMVVSGQMSPADYEASTGKTAPNMSTMPNFSPAAPPPQNPDKPLAQLMSGQMTPQAYQQMTGKAPPGAGRGGPARDPALAMATPMERQLRGNIQGDELDKRNALAEQGNVQQQRAQAQYQQMAENQAMQEHLQATQQLDEQKRDAESKDRLAQLQSRADQLAGEKVDPNRLYANASTGSKIMAGIGLLFGALGAGGTGGENKSVGIIKDAIDRDIMAQKATLANKQESMSQARGLYQDRLKQYGDERQAALATKIDMLAIAQAKIQTTAAQYDSPEIQAKADQAVSELKKESDTIGLNWYDADKARAQALAAAAAARAAAHAEKIEGWNHETLKGERVHQQAMELEDLKNGGEKTVRVLQGADPDGTPHFEDVKANNKESATQLRKFSAEATAQMQTLKELQALMKTANPLSLKDSRAARAKAAELIERQPSLNGLTRYTELEKDNAETQVPKDPNTLLNYITSGNDEMLANYGAGLKRLNDSAIRLHSGGVTKTAEQHADALGRRAPSGK